jgi:hypothetical protein
MKSVICIVAAAALTGALGGCAADPYYPGYGYSQAAYYPSGYGYRTYNSYPSYSYPSYGYSYPSYGYSYPSSYYGYNSTWDYYRNYNGIHPGPERTTP